MSDHHRKVADAEHYIDALAAEAATDDPAVAGYDADMVWCIYAIALQNRLKARGYGLDEPIVLEHNSVQLLITRQAVADAIRKRTDQ